MTNVNHNIVLNFNISKKIFQQHFQYQPLVRVLRGGGGRGGHDAGGRGPARLGLRPRQPHHPQDVSTSDVMVTVSQVKGDEGT